jgi:hypothetical protein
MIGALVIHGAEFVQDPTKPGALWQLTKGVAWKTGLSALIAGGTAFSSSALNSIGNELVLLGNTGLGGTLSAIAKNASGILMTTMFTASVVGTLKKFREGKITWREMAADVTVKGLQTAGSVVGSSLVVAAMAILGVTTALVTVPVAVLAGIAGGALGAHAGRQLDENIFRSKDEGLRKAYAFFDLPVGAPAPEVNQAYRAIAKLTHPDRTTGIPPIKREELTLMFRQATVALELIRAHVLESARKVVDDSGRGAGTGGGSSNNDDSNAAAAVD